MSQVLGFLCPTRLTWYGNLSISVWLPVRFHPHGEWHSIPYAPRLRIDSSVTGQLVSKSDVQSLGRIRLFATPRTAARQAPLSLTFPEPTQTHVQVLAIVSLGYCK